MARCSIKREHQAAVLLKSRRRCALCFGLRGDLSEKNGQIAHIDRDHSHSALENLAFLCLRHHDQYDSTTSQSKGLTSDELRTYRDRLYHEIADTPRPAPAEICESDTPNSFMSGSMPRVLLFEDSEACRKQFQSVLRERADLFWAMDVRIAEDQLLRIDPDLVITDLNLFDHPGSGVRLIRRIKELSNVPIVVCSKYISPLSPEESLSAKWGLPSGTVASILPKFPFPTADQLLSPLRVE